jgi:hypothetical protein
MSGVTTGTTGARGESAERDPAHAVGSREDLRAARTGRVVTYGLLALMAAMAFIDFNLWPVTSTRLFSTPRSGASSRVEVYAVVDGEEHRVDGTAVACSRLTRQVQDRLDRPFDEVRVYRVKRQLVRTESGLSTRVVSRRLDRECPGA